LLLDELGKLEELQLLLTRGQLEESLSVHGPDYVEVGVVDLLAEQQHLEELKVAVPR